MLRDLQRAIREHRLLQPGQHVVVAVSGGADSVALLHGLSRLRSLRLRLTVAHLHHGLRGREADADLDFVRELGARLNLDVRYARRRVRDLARRRGWSLEMAARRARYRFLAEVARNLAADAVATGHTADDQVETFLLRLARGGGPAGLAGIPRRGEHGGVPVVRPLLSLKRRAIAAFLKRHGLAWREDRSNRDPDHLRNRVRHEVLPLLEERLNPGFRRAVLRTVDILRADEGWLEAEAGRRFAACRRGCDLDAGLAGGLPLPIRRRVLRLWLSASGLPPERLGFETVRHADSLLRSERGSAEAVLPGGRAVRTYGVLRFEPGAPGDPPRPFRAWLPVPGEVALPESGIRIRAWLAPGIAHAAPARPGLLPARGSLRRASVGRRRLLVRSRQPGDRMRPLGVAGTRKLQDIFVDAKVPARLRDAVPVLECGGRIVWLPGYRVAQGWEVLDPERPAVQVAVETLDAGVA